jgi:PAS domain S-box-containing protein
MPMSRSHRAPTAEFRPAQCLQQEKAHIIQTWEKLARARLPPANTKPRPALLNRLPEFLDELADSLAARRPRLAKSRDLAKAHGLQRTRLQGYTLDHVFYEYYLLTQVIFATLDRYGFLTARDRDTILQFVETGRMEAAREFSQVMAVRHQAYESAIRSSEEHVWFLINSLPSIAWSLDAGGRLDFINERFYEYTGEPRVNPPRQDWRPFLHPDDRAMAVREWRSGIASGKPFQFEFRWKRASDGSYRWHMARGVPIKGSEGNIRKWVGLTFDIDAQKRAQAQLEHERALREHFINALSHDLKNPLAAAQTAGELIARNPEKPQNIPKLASLVLEGLNRADRMIRDLLDISRIRAGKELSAPPAPANLAEVFCKVRDEFVSLHGDHFSFELPKSLWGIWSQEDLRRVLENLLSNAIKYGAPSSPIQVKLRREGGECVFSVHNFGNPISPANQRKIFEPFSQLQANKAGHAKGWGIGLAVVKSVVDAHQGQVLVKSSAEAGTTFTVRLPIRERD